jgi:hypothetical protein
MLSSTGNHADGPFLDLETREKALRQQIYRLLLVVGAGLILGRILAVDEVEVQQLQSHRLAQIPKRIEEKRERLIQQGAREDRIEQELEKTRRALYKDAYLQRPTLSGNDRSRWCTLRALVEPEMRVIRTVETDRGAQREYVWYAIDKVTTQKGWDTIDMVKHGLPDQPEGEEYLYSSKPPLLPTLMAVPYAILFHATGMDLGENTYTVVRILLVVLNLIPLLILWIVLWRLVERFGTTNWGRVFAVAVICLATFLSTFAVTLNNHIPGAVSIGIALYAAVRIWFDDERRLRYFALAGFFGAFSVACELPALAFLGLLSLTLLWKAPRETFQAFVPMALLVGAAFFATNYIAHHDLRPAYMHRDEGDDWYDYTYEVNGVVKESYWRNRTGIDRGEPSRLVYLFHSTFGHHGVFSLTPVWILSFVGMGILLARRGGPRLQQMALFVLTLSVVVFTFYMMRPQIDRNYGGMTSGFRWMFWFIPLWVPMMLPALDRMAENRFRRWIALLLLLISVLSAAYPIWNPWIHPWLYNIMAAYGWTTY